LCIVSIEKQHVVRTVAEAAERGTKQFVVFSSGFAETGESTDRMIQEQLEELCDSLNLKLLGPNSIGFMNVNEGIYATFTQVLDVCQPLKGPVAIVMQSGAVAAHLFTLLVKHGLGVCYLVATGNEVGIRIEDVLLTLADCPDCTVVAVGAETLRNGQRLLEAIDLLHHAGKAVVFLKIGSSESGSVAVRSHSAGVAGDSDLIEAILETRGVYISRSLTSVMRNVEALARSSQAVARCGADRKEADNRLGIISHSGGFGILMADAAERAGLTVPPLQEGVQTALKNRLGLHTVGNPVDVTGQMLNDPGRLRHALDEVAAVSGFDGIALFLGVLGINPDYVTERMALFGRLVEIAKSKPVGLAAILSLEDQQALRSGGVIVREDATETVEDLAIVLKDQRLTRKRNAAHSNHRSGAPVTSCWKSMVSHRSPVEVPRVMDGMQYMRERHFPVVESIPAYCDDDAAAAQRQLGGLVTMKAIGPGILHRRELGLVYLNIYDETHARSAFQALTSRIRSSGLLGAEVRVFPQITEGIEVFVGFKRNSPVGPIILAGSGGSLVELFRDVACEVAPTSARAAEAMLARTHVLRLLSGYREPNQYGRRALVDFLVAFSRMAANERDLLEVDLNPVIVRRDNHGLVILDAKIAAKNPTM
jgi:acyl-CoA synthetase (NDP forming)